nr:RNA polymerase sigma factor [Allomuricauda sp.]
MSKHEDDFYRKRVLSGDREAFAFFIDKYQQMAFSIAISITKQENAAKEVVQNAFIQVFKSLRSFKGESLFSTWLHRIVVNESLKFVRKNKKERIEMGFDDAMAISFTVKNDALSAIEIEEKKEEIRRVLLTLKPKERLVLTLFYLKEFSHAEISESTGFSKNNVKILLHRGRKSFASAFTLINKK